MSDYLYCSSGRPNGVMTKALSSIYLHNAPMAQEFHGPWGSLAITDSRYKGFSPIENENHIMIVIGGPVLYFQDNDFLMNQESSIGTKAIYQRWIIEDRIKWDDDLSGPFTILLIEKRSKKIRMITDLMSFIPAYILNSSKEIAIGSHIDALATVSGESDNLDPISLTDFILNDVITYPHTAYLNIRQLPPSSTIWFDCLENIVRNTHYWLPTEQKTFSTIEDAAEALGHGIKNYIDRVTNKMSTIAQFISGGEDSRSLAGMMPKNLQRDGYVFLDQINREGLISSNVAKAYGVDLNIGYRGKNHYLEILQEATQLVGTGHQYTHAHSLTFDRKFNLDRYTAVFGGFLSDTILKGHYVAKRGSERLSFMPQKKREGHSPIAARFKESPDYFKYANEVKERQSIRLTEVQKIRKETAPEWFNFYPCSMHNDMPNLYFTRRLFRSYEPFMCKEAVKVSASVPTEWKLNRRLFNLATKPYLRPTMWLLHADGRLPYFNWKVNFPLQSAIWSYRQVAKRTGLIRGNQGPWGDWRAMLNSKSWEKLTKNCLINSDPLDIFREGISERDILFSDRFTFSQRVNLLQALHSVFNRKEL